MCCVGTVMIAVLKKAKGKMQDEGGLKGALKFI